MDAQHKQSALLNLFAALRACDHAIIRCTEQAPMFESVCRSLVETGDMQLAWIGMLDVGDKRLWPQAYNGAHGTSQTWMRLVSSAGQGLAELAVSQGVAIWSDDAQHAAMFQSMLALAQNESWRCAAALPLFMREQVCGVLSVYDSNADGFDNHTRELLLQLASNISAALLTLDRSEQRRQGEFAMMESEVRYNALFASNPMPMLVIDPSDGRIVDANIRAMNFYGWNQLTITNQLVQDIIVQSPGEIREVMARAASTDSSHLDFKHRLANGEVRDVEVFTSPLSFKGQTFLVSAINDVTERRMLEAKVHQTQSLMQCFIDQLPGTAFVKDSTLRLLMANRQLGAVLG